MNGAPDEPNIAHYERGLSGHPVPQTGVERNEKSDRMEPLE